MKQSSKLTGNFAFRKILCKSSVIITYNFCLVHFLGYFANIASGITLGIMRNDALSEITCRYLRFS